MSCEARGSTVKLTVLVVAAILSSMPSTASAHVDRGRSSWGSSASPALSIIPAAAATGEWVQVLVVGAPPRTPLIVELCGSAQPQNLETCDESTAVNAVADSMGVAQTSLRINPPDAGCPCWVRASAVEERVAFEVAAAVEVDGHPGAVIGSLDPSGAAETSSALRVVQAKLTDGGSWAAWFGARAERTLEVTVQNTGDAGIAAGELHLRSDPPGEAADLPALALGTLSAGERRTVRARIAFDPLAWGERTVLGEVRSPSGVVSFDARTTSYPWGLVALGILALELLLVAGRNRLRRRFAVDPLAVDPELARRVGEGVVATLRRRPRAVARLAAQRVVTSLRDEGAKRQP